MNAGPFLSVKVFGFIHYQAHISLNMSLISGSKSGSVSTLSTEEKTDHCLWGLNRSVSFLISQRNEERRIGLLGHLVPAPGTSRELVLLLLYIICVTYLHSFVVTSDASATIVLPLLLTIKVQGISHFKGGFLFNFWKTLFYQTMSSYWNSAFLR